MQIYICMMLHKKCTIYIINIIYMCMWVYNVYVYNIIYTERDNSQRQTNDDNGTRDDSRRVPICNAISSGVYRYVKYIQPSFP